MPQLMELRIDILETIHSQEEPQGILDLKVQLKAQYQWLLQTHLLLVK